MRRLRAERFLKSSGWISSSRKLPALDVPVLGYTRRGEFAVVFTTEWDDADDYDGGRNKWHQWQDQQRDQPVVDGDFDNAGDVPYWRPLPDSPLKATKKERAARRAWNRKEKSFPKSKNLTFRFPEL